MAKRGGRLVSLAEKQGPLKREEVICPICWSVLMEPVGLPCKHNLCLDCFKKHVEETSLQCPCCRMRLSVWSRRAFREKNLVDTKLWERIQKEFPKLVQTRICGEDSQDLLPEDLVSVHDKNGHPPEVQTVSEEESSPKRWVRDGDFSTANGDIRRELESTLRKHQEDIENQHRIEESASVDLIRQLQEEGELPKIIDASIIEVDFQLAQKLEEEEKNSRLAEITARRKLFTEPKPESSATKISSMGTKLISEWTQNQDCSSSNISKTFECNGISTPKSSSKRRSQSSLASRSLKKTKKTKTHGLIKNSSSQKSNGLSQGSQNNQHSILSYLSSSQFSNSAEECSQSMLSPQPSTSASALKNSRGHRIGTSSDIADKLYPSYIPDDTLFSAFSPTKASKGNTTSRLVPGGLLYNSVPKIINRFLKFSKSTQNTREDIYERETPTPNSIDLEVNCHFRPIRSAPKSPPKRLLNGTYLPEHLIIKTTPVKILHLPPTDLDSLIAGKPHKIVSEDGKRVSDDSGRASVSSVASESVVEILSDSDSGSGCVTKSKNEVKLEPSSSAGRNLLTIPQILTLSSPNIKSNMVHENDRNCTRTLLHGIHSVGNDSPSSASDFQRRNDNTMNPDLSWLKEEDDDSLTPSQDSRIIDFTEMNLQEAEFERIRLKLLQENEDRKFALKLQRDMNKGIQPEKRYGLRSWLKTASGNTDSRSSK